MDDSLVPPEYRSATEFHYEKEQADAIIQIATYQRKDYRLSVIRYSTREHDRISQSISVPFQRISEVGLGSLDKLPTELLFNVLSYLDMHSLFKFRQINLRSRLSVNSLNQYQKVALHGHELFRALLQTGIATHITLLDFYEALCTEKCAVCGEFAGFIFILSWMRCCFRCLEKSPETQVRTLASVRNHLKMSKAQICQLWSFKCFPGTYGMNYYKHKQKPRFRIVSLHQAILARGTQLNAPLPIKLRLSYCGTKFNFMGSCALPHYDKRTGRIEEGVSCVGCQLAMEKQIIGTRDTDWGYAARNKLYSREGFLDHFRWCEQAQVVWNLSRKFKVLQHEQTTLASMCADIVEEARTLVGCNNWVLDKEHPQDVA